MSRHLSPLFLSALLFTACVDQSAYMSDTAAFDFDEDGFNAGSDWDGEDSPGRFNREDDYDFRDEDLESEKLSREPLEELEPL